MNEKEVTSMRLYSVYTLWIERAKTISLDVGCSMAKAMELAADDYYPDTGMTKKEFLTEMRQIDDIAS